MAVGAYGSQGSRHGMTHPVFDMQRAMNGQATAAAGSTFGGDFGDFIDDTPRVVAGVIVASVVVLFLLKRAGFRFNFGVGANVGR